MTSFNNSPDLEALKASTQWAYRNQKTSKYGNGYNECFAFALGMGMKLVGVPYDPTFPDYHNGLDLPEYLREIADHKGNPYQHEVECAAANAYLQKETTVADQFEIEVIQDPANVIKEIIDAGGVVVIGTTLAKIVAPQSDGGHMVLVVGYDDYQWYVLDPFGDAASHYSVENGNCAFYAQDWEYMQCLNYGISIKKR